MNEEVFNYIVQNVEMYNRQFNDEEIREVYDTYMSSNTHLNKNKMISHIESYHQEKNNKERSQEELDNIKHWRKSRRASVCSESFYPNDYFCVSYPKTPELFQFLSDTLVKDVPFGFLTPRQKYKLIDTMRNKEIQKGIVLIREGERDNKMYIVEEGSFDVIKNKCKIKVLKKGDYFGEIALLHNVERTATVISREDSKIWEVEQKVFLGLRASDRNRNKGIILDGITRLGMYPDLDEHEMISFINTLSFDYCIEDTDVIVKDDEVFMFVADGTILLEGEQKDMKSMDILYKSFKCVSVVEGSVMKTRQRKLKRRNV